jgi:ribonuclease HI
MDDTPLVELYTDGACIPNPGSGGWAALLRSGGKEKILSGSEAQTTNNRMELTAALRGLEALKRPCRVKIYTDSEYLKRGVTARLPGWRKRGWKRKEGALANSDLWQALDAVLQQHQIEWYWVRGHAGHAENELVDELARQAIRRS